MLKADGIVPAGTDVRVIIREKYTDSKIPRRLLFFSQNFLRQE